MTDDIRVEAAARTPGGSRLDLAEAARREGNPLALHDLCQVAIEAGEANARFRYLQVFALAQMGDTARAQRLYDAYELREWGDDEDALALQGRLHKDRALAADGEDRRAGFENAEDAYLRAYAVRSGYFPGINAATTAWAAGDRGTARTMARAVLGHPELNPPLDFFATMSGAEALVLLGRKTEAAEWVRRALGFRGAGYGERASAVRQLDWLCASAGFSDAGRTSLLSPLRPPPVVAFTGHMFREGDAAEAALAARIATEIDSLHSTIAYGALACGADILFAEQILKRNGELHVVLPFATADFVAASVRPGGERWVARFEACLDRARSVTFATRAEFVGHDSQFAYGGLLAMGLAELRARQISTLAVQLAIWDGKPARGEAGAAIDVTTWRRAGLASRVIDPGPLDRRLERPARKRSEVKRVARAMIFTDYKGYSRLPESAAPAFNREIFGRMARVLDRHRDFVCSRNTWGDALYAVVSDAVEAAEIALEITESLREVDLPILRSAEGDGMRVGLHYGPIFQDIDPVTGADSFFGAEVTLAARIEPSAIPGAVYTTQAFAAMLAMAGSRRCAVRYLGKLPLAKGYGALPIYQLERVGPRRAD